MLVGNMNNFLIFQGHLEISSIVSYIFVKFTNYIWNFLTTKKFYRPTVLLSWSRFQSNHDSFVWRGVFLTDFDRWF